MLLLRSILELSRWQVAEGTQFSQWPILWRALFSKWPILKWLILKVTNFSKCDFSKDTHFSKSHFFDVIPFIEWLICEKNGFEVTNFRSNPFFQVQLFRSYSFPQVPLFPTDPSPNWLIFSTGSLLKISSFLNRGRNRNDLFSQATDLRSDPLSNWYVLTWVMTHVTWLIFRSDLWKWPLSSEVIMTPWLICFHIQILCKRVKSHYSKVIF